MLRLQGGQEEQQSLQCLKVLALQSHLALWMSFAVGSDSFWQHCSLSVSLRPPPSAARRATAGQEAGGRACSSSVREQEAGRGWGSPCYSPAFSGAARAGAAAALLGTEASSPVQARKTEPSSAPSGTKPGDD